MDEPVKRLEAVASRLESISRQLASVSSAGAQGAADDESADTVDRLPVIQEYEALINDSVNAFVAVSKKIGGDLTTMSDHVSRLFTAQQQFLRQAVQSKKPADKGLTDAIKPQSSEIEAITGI